MNTPSRLTPWLACCLLVAVGLFALAQDETLLDFVYQEELPRAQSKLGTRLTVTIRAWDVWADGALAAVSAGPLVHLVDLADVQSPSVTTIDLGEGNESWDVKVKDGLLFAGLQLSADGTSLLIYDVADPTNPELIGRFASNEFAGAHNIFIQENTVFIATLGAVGAPQLGLTPDLIEGRLWLVDISDPANPADLGPLREAEGEDPIVHVHDVSVIGNRAYLGAWDTGFWLVDFENLDNPAELGYEVAAHHKYTPFFRTRNWPDPSTHNVWPSEDGKIVWTTDEVVGEGIRAFDVSDPDNIEIVGFFNLDQDALPHNVFIDGEFAYVSHYLDGVRVLRLDPEGGIEEVASFITSNSPPQGNPFAGAFGVYPFGDYVLISDTFNGLIVLEKQGILKAIEDAP